MIGPKNDINKKQFEIYFIWDHLDDKEVYPLVSYIYKKLSQDNDHPFSRYLNIPVFFRTNLKGKTPASINNENKEIIVFPFIGKNVVASSMWNDYFESELCGKAGKSFYIIPIAIDQYAFKLNEMFNNRNFIRLDFSNSSTENDINNEHCFFIKIAHEIYRFGLNMSQFISPRGKFNSLRIFLSHTKKDKNALEVARKLKVFMDSSTTFQNFFDVTDIAPGYNFESEIKEGLHHSAFIALVSDHYTERYWCQKEIIQARKNNLPMIAVDLLQSYEDRAFPFLTNIPVIRVNDIENKSEIFRLMECILIETLRFQYSKYIFGKDNRTYLLRPPDPVVFFLNKEPFSTTSKELYYPEPELFYDEVEVLEKFFPKIRTFTSLEIGIFNEKNIGLSISTPSREEMIDYGVDGSHLKSLTQRLQLFCLRQNANLIYGGDFRENGFTNLLLEEGIALQERMKSKRILFTNYIAWPIYEINPTMNEWKAKCYGIANLKYVPILDSIKSLISKADPFAEDIKNPLNAYIRSRCLTDMRERMVENCDIRICAGGKSSGYQGYAPGVLEEALIAIRMGKPLYLLGGFGGITGAICHYICDGERSEEGQKVTLSWQVSHNPSYMDLIKLYEERNVKQFPYEQLETLLTFPHLNNGLNEDENKKLFYAQDFREIIGLIANGVKKIGKDKIRKESKP